MPDTVLEALLPGLLDSLLEVATRVAGARDGPAGGAGSGWTPNRTISTMRQSGALMILTRHTVRRRYPSDEDAFGLELTDDGVICC